MTDAKKLILKKIVYRGSKFQRERIYRYNEILKQKKPKFVIIRKLFTGFHI